MKITLSDLMDDCFVEEIELSGEDETVNKEWKEKIMQTMKEDAAFRKKHRLSKYLVVAAVAAATVCTVFAASLFHLEKQVLDGEKMVSGITVSQSEEGDWVETKTSYDGVGMKLSFQSDGTPNQVWLHPNYLPEGTEINDSQGLNIEGEEGWYSYLTGEEMEGPIPWQIEALYAFPESEYILLGEVENISEDTWDNLSVTKVSISRETGAGAAVKQGDMTEPLDASYDRVENYIFLFDQENGYLIRIAGELEMEELEKIAKNLEIQVTDTPIEPAEWNRGLGLLNIGRG